MGLVFGCNVYSQPSAEAASLLHDLFEPDSLTNLSISVLPNCPPQLAKGVSNGNLFTLEEQKLLQQILTKYKNVTTNSGLSGAILMGRDKSSNYCVAHFSHTNSAAQEDIIFRNSPEQPPRDGGYEELVSPTSSGSNCVARFRPKGKIGYDAITTPDKREVLTVAQIKNGKASGLVVEFEDDNCQELLHFIGGRAVGKWLLWGRAGNDYLLEVKINSPLVYFKYMTREVNMKSSMAFNSRRLRPINAWRRLLNCGLRTACESSTREGEELCLLGLDRELSARCGEWQPRGLRNSVRANWVLWSINR